MFSGWVWVTVNRSKCVSVNVSECECKYHWKWKHSSTFHPWDVKVRGKIYPQIEEKRFVVHSFALSFIHSMDYLSLWLYLSALRFIFIENVTLEVNKSVYLSATSTMERWDTFLSLCPLWSRKMRSTSHCCVCCVANGYSFTEMTIERERECCNCCDHSESIHLCRFNVHTMREQFHHTSVRLCVSVCVSVYTFLCESTISVGASMSGLHECVLIACVAYVDGEDIREDVSQKKTKYTANMREREWKSERGRESASHR